MLYTMMDNSFLYNPLLYNSKNWVMELGDCPNIELPTAGGEIFWFNRITKNGWKLQDHMCMEQSRILDQNNIRKAWGSPSVMQEKFKRLTRAEFIEPGDVLGVARQSAMRIYEHYTVYIGNGRVIHYAGENDFEFDSNRDIRIREASLSDFLKSDRYYFVLFFDNESQYPHKIQTCTNFNMDDRCMDNVLDLRRNREFHLYSAEETIRRAKSRIGETQYDLVFNNCEHFAIWCKTGVAESYQVKRFLNCMKPTFPKTWMA